jgi:hypothetical protein
MNRDFVGTGYKEPGSCGVDVEQDGKRNSLTHKVRGYDTNYQWDGGGPGSTDLARALLWEVTGVEPEWRIYRLFKNEIVATWPMQLGECWRISEEEILRWLARVERDTVRTESDSRAEARLEQMRDRELRLKNFGRISGKR